MRSRVGTTRSRIGGVRSAVGTGGGSVSSPVVSAITLSPATGTANSPSGTVIGTLAVVMSSGTLTNPELSLTNTAGGDFQLINRNQVAFLPNNVPAGNYTITAQVAASNLTSPFSTSLPVTIEAQTVVTPPTPSVPTGQATKIELRSQKSVVSAGTPVSVDIIPNANWAGQVISLAFSKGSGTIPASITAPSSGNATLTFSCTPTGVENAISATGNDLYSPWPHPINCFNASSGSPQSVSATLVLDDLAVHQFDVWGRTPFAFDAMASCIGWGEGPLTMGTSGPALFARYYDALSAGATSVAGTGTPLHSAPVQIYGSFSSGQTIIPLHPASNDIYFVDLATDSGFTNPFRVTKRFSVGLAVGINQRSYYCALARAYGLAGAAVTGTVSGNVLTVTATPGGYSVIQPNSSITTSAGNARITSFGTGTGATGTYNLDRTLTVNTAEQIMTNAPTGQTYAKAVANCTFDVRFGAVTSWFRHDGISANYDTYAYNEASSAATQRFGELVDHYMRVTCGFSGASIAGGGLVDHINHDGTPCQGFIDTIRDRVRNKFRWLWLNNIGDENSNANTNPYNLSEVYSRIPANIDYSMRTYSACSVVGLAVAGNGYDGDGSTQVANSFFPAGQARLLLTLLGGLGAHVRNITSVGSLNGNNVASHPNQAARAMFAEIGFRALYAGELAAFGGLQTDQIGPKIGTCTRTGNTVYAQIVHAGGSSLVSHALSFSSPYDPTRTFQTATGSELASIITLYAGANGSAGSGAAVIHIDSVAIDNANDRLVIALTPGQNLPDDLTLHINADFGVSNTTIPNTASGQNTFRAAFLTDERTDSNVNYQYGWTMLPQIDMPVTVAA